jgi:NAD(P)-dependent dehydrogenase (short-subunit alcohol dehydrogenase family)
MLPRRSGSIVHFASLLSYQGGLTVPAYAAAKGGIAQMVKALANEWSKDGVRVNAVVPGYVRTDMCVFLSLTFLFYIRAFIVFWFLACSRFQEDWWDPVHSMVHETEMETASSSEISFLYSASLPFLSISTNLLNRYHLMNRASERASGYYWVHKLTLRLIDRNEKLLADPTRLRQISERIPAGRWGEPEDFAGPVVFLASKASMYVCGELVVVDGVRHSVFLPP